MFGTVLTTAEEKDMSSSGESLGKAMFGIMQRCIIEGCFSDLNATSFMAMTGTGSDYSAALTGAPVRSFCYQEENSTYEMREVRSVTINGQACPAVTAIGYCIATSTLLALDAADQVVRRSSTITSIIMS
jgi:hypothetical protein